MLYFVWSVARWVCPLKQYLCVRFVCISCDTVARVENPFRCVYLFFSSPGRYEDAFWELNMAATMSDELVYDEPWGWMQPPLHALGALSLEQVYYALHCVCKYVVLFRSI